MKIAIAGYGIEGEANYRYWARQTGHDITIVDEALVPKNPLPDGVKTLLGPGVYGQLDGYDLVVRTAGLAPRKINTNGKIWSSTNEFFAHCPADIIGVTGTKGKGTTSSLIAKILEAAGKKVWLVGNIGVSALAVLDQIQSEDIVVFELSSFQLWDIEKSPHIAVITIIEADHLDIHEDMEEYVAAKARIRQFQTDDDVCIYHPTNGLSKAIASSYNRGKTIRYGVSDGGGVYVEDGAFRADEGALAPVEALQLVGLHNQENACAAITACLEYNVTPGLIEVGLRTFKGLPHRIEFVREYEGVAYYNDSYASAPMATAAAIESFSRPTIVIIGGTDKGSDFTALFERMKRRTNVKQIVFIGTTRTMLVEKLEPAGLKVPFTVVDGTGMPEVVEAARSVACPGDVILLSPGCASFDMFKDFSDRGNQFREYVQSL